MEDKPLLPFVSFLRCSNDVSSYSLLYSQIPFLLTYTESSQIRLFTELNDFVCERIVRESTKIRRVSIRLYLI